MRSGAIALTLLVGAAGHALPQDLEMLSRASGRPLPGAYYELLARKPNAFQPPGEWAALSRRAPGVRAFPQSVRFVVIPALFSDSPDPTVTQADLQRVLFDGPYAEGTLQEYYATMSGGLFDLGGTVLPWVRTGITLDEAVGSSQGFGDDARLGDYLVQALEAADPLVDFGQFDSNGADGVPNSPDDNGIVDLVAFYFIEPDAACPGPGPWPHFSGISVWRDGQRFETADLRPNDLPVTVDQYVIQSAVDCAGVDVAPVGAMAHEIGHLVGLPDLYDASGGLQPEQRRWVVGCWSLMSAGAWGCGNADRSMWRRPTSIGAWERKRLGWYDEILTVSNTALTTVDLTPVQNSGTILELPLSDEERLLIEYRAQTGFDSDLPAEGVLVYRVNDTIPQIPCTGCEPVYRVSLVEADGNRGLLRTTLEGGNRGEAGDVFGALGTGKLTNATDPSTRLDAGLGGESDVNVYEITLTPSGAQLLLSTTVIASDRLVGPFLLDQQQQLTLAEQEFLDGRNNANGRYDVGDLRAYLQRPR